MEMKKQDIAMSEGGILNIRPYKMELRIFILFAVAYVAFCYYLMPEFIYQSWFDQMPLAQKWFDGTLTFQNLVTRFGEHGMLGYNILFIINVILFRMSSHFDVIINDFCVIGFAAIALYHLRKGSGRDRSVFYCGAVILLCMSGFGFILSSSGAMETQVRIGVLFSALIAHVVNKCFVEGCSNKYLIWTCIIIFLGINVFGTMYSFGVYPVIFIIAAVQVFRARKLLRPQVVICVVCFACFILYILEYSVLGQSFAVLNHSGGLLTSLVAVFTKPLFTLGSFIYCNAASVLGYGIFIDEMIPHSVYFAVGVVVSILLLLSIYLYFKAKMYQRSIFPVLLIGYSVVVWLLVHVGRSLSLAAEGLPGISHATCWWYVCNWKAQVIGMIIIFYNYYKEAHPVSANSFRKNFTSGLAFVLLGTFLLGGEVGALHRLPAERRYFLGMQMWLFADEEDELPVDENGVSALVWNKEQCLQGIALMKEHSLGVYRYYGSYTKLMDTIGKNLDGTVKAVVPLEGYYEDKWLAKESRFQIQAGEEGLLHIELYQTDEARNSMAGAIVIGEKSYPFNLTGANTVLEYPVKPNSIFDIAIIMDGTITNSGNDLRKLSVVLSGISCS